MARANAQTLEEVKTKGATAQRSKKDYLRKDGIAVACTGRRAALRRTGKRGRPLLLLV